MFAYKQNSEFLLYRRYYWIKGINIIIINKYILDFIYLMPWKFVCDLRF